MHSLLSKASVVRTTAEMEASQISSIRGQDLRTQKQDEAELDSKHITSNSHQVTAASQESGYGTAKHGLNTYLSRNSQVTAGSQEYRYGSAKQGLNT